MASGEIARRLVCRLALPSLIVLARIWSMLGCGMQLAAVRFPWTASWAPLHVYAIRRSGGGERSELGRSLNCGFADQARARVSVVALSLRWRSRLLLCRIEFCGEQKPIFSDQKPGVAVFWLPSLSSSFQAILTKLTVSKRRHNTHLKNQLTEKSWAVRGSNSQLVCDKLGQLRATSSRAERVASVPLRQIRTMTANMAERRLKWSAGSTADTCGPQPERHRAGVFFCRTQRLRPFPSGTTAGLKRYLWSTQENDLALADFEPGPFLWRRGLHAMREAMNRNAPSTMRNQTIVPATSKMLSFITPTHTSAKEHATAGAAH